MMRFALRTGRFHPLPGASCRCACMAMASAASILSKLRSRRPFQQARAAVGLVNLFAAHAGAVPLNLETLYQQELTLTGTYSSSPKELRLALGLLASGAVRVNDLISHRLPLSRFSEGVTLMRERAALKVYFQIAVG